MRLNGQNTSLLSARKFKFAFKSKIKGLFVITLLKNTLFPAREDSNYLNKL